MDNRNKCSDKRFLVFGTGISGIAAAELLLRNGGQVLLYDGNGQLDKEEIREKSDIFKDIEIILGELKEEVLEDLDVAVLSPGDRSCGSGDDEEEGDGNLGRN